MESVTIKLPKHIDSRLQINIQNVGIDNEYQIVLSYSGYTYNVFDVSLSAAFERVSTWIENMEMKKMNRG